MNSRSGRLLGTLGAMVAWLAVSIPASYAQSVNYSYDDLNRLKWIDDGNVVIVYKYDDVGNRLSETLRFPPVTTAFPPRGAGFQFPDP